MLGGQTSTLLLTCLSLASLFLSHTFFSPTTSLSLSSPHTQTLVTIKQVVLSSCLSPCLYLCAIYELSQLFLTLEPQLTPGICMPMCTLLHAHTHTHTHLQTSTHSLHSLLLFLTAAALSLSALRLQANPCQRVILSVSQCVNLFSHMHHSPEPFQILPLT